MLKSKTRKKAGSFADSWMLRTSLQSLSEFLPRIEVLLQEIDRNNEAVGSVNLIINDFAKRELIAVSNLIRDLLRLGEPVNGLPTGDRSSLALNIIKRFCSATTSTDLSIELSERDSLIQQQRYDLYKKFDLIYQDINTICRNIMLFSTTKKLASDGSDAEMQEDENVKSKSVEESLRTLLLGENLQGPEVDRIVKLIITQVKISLARSSRVAWKERNKHGFSDVTAPEFLMLVHAADIENGTVHKEYIRAIDSDLMDAVDAYISQREKRGLTLGRAQGLKFVSSRPAPNRRTGVRKPGRGKHVRELG